MALPSVLHLNVFAALLLDDVFRIDLPRSVETFRLQHFQIGGNNAPSIIKRLISVIFINQSKRFHELEHLIGHRSLRARCVHPLPVADERRHELTAQPRELCVVAGNVAFDRLIPLNCIGYVLARHPSAMAIVGRKQRLTKAGKRLPILA